MGWLGESTAAQRVDSVFRLLDTAVIHSFVATTAGRLIDRSEGRMAGFVTVVARCITIGSQVAC